MSNMGGLAKLVWWGVNVAAFLAAFFSFGGFYWSGFNFLQSGIFAFAIVMLLAFPLVWWWAKGKNGGILTAWSKAGLWIGLLMLAIAAVFELVSFLYSLF